MRIFKNFSDSELKKMKDDKYNVIGLDFGDGETAAAYFTKYVNTPQAFFVDGSNTRTKIVTAIFIPNDNSSNVNVGQNAVNSASDRNPGKFYINFKCKPSEADAQAEFIGEYRQNDHFYTKREVMQLFVQGFLDIIFSVKANNLNPDQDTILLIGRPAGGTWEGEEELNYQKMFSENLRAGNKKVKQVMVLSESFAALAQTVGVNNQRFNFEDTIICADSGSSTFDVTYVSNGENKNEYGVNLGAKYIEKNMLTYILELANEEKKTNFSIRDLADPMVLMNMRTAKENYFGDEGKRPLQRQPFTLQIRDEFNTKVIDQEFMNHVIYHMKVEYNDRTQLKGFCTFKSWDDACKIFFENMKKGILKDINKVKKVILTGGGSKMSFVGEHAKEILGKDLIEHSSEPSYTVAKGLAWIARHEINTEILYRQIMSEMDTIINNSVTKYLLTNISEELAKNLLDDVIMPILADWRVRNYITLNDAAKAMDEKCNKKINEDSYQLTIHIKIRDWFNENYPKVINALNKRIGEGLNIHVPENMRIQLPVNVYKDIYSSVQLIKINVNSGEFLNRVLGSMGFGLVMFEYDHSLTKRIDLYNNAVHLYPNHLLKGFDTAKLFFIESKHVDGLETQVFNQLSQKGDAIYNNIFRVLKESMKDSIANQVEMMAMYVYKQRY